MARDELPPGIVGNAAAVDELEGDQIGLSVHFEEKGSPFGGDEIPALHP